jgi:N-carbamoylputrescine amidase
MSAPSNPRRSHPDGLRALHRAEPRPRLGHGPRGCPRRRPDRLPAGAVSLPVFLPARGPRPLRPGRVDSRPSTERLAAIVRDEKITLIASLFERRAAGLYHNTAAVLDHASPAPDHIAGIYRKMHIPDDPLYYEKFYFAPGDLGFRAIPTSEGNVGTLICWDQWYPEAARLTALMGANTSSTPLPSAGTPARNRVRRSAVLRLADHAARPRHRQRRFRLRGQPRRPRARRRRPQMALPSRGPGDHTPASGLEFWGGSFIADPFGRILAQASHDRKRF